jgi:glycosyltransferase 2 family protein
VGNVPAPAFNWKRYAHAAGGLFAIAGLAFVIVQLRRYGASLDKVSLSEGDWWAFACLVVVGVGMNACLGLAWRSVLASSGNEITRRWAVATYAMTHVARYVPGNIFHYAGRQAVGMAAGLPARSLARASLLELLMVAASGVLLGLYAVPLMVPGFQGGAWPLLVSCAVLIAPWIVLRVRGQAMARALAYYLIYLVASAVTFIVLVRAHGGTVSGGVGGLAAVGGAYVAAWLIGMITPGAPAGLGVREAVVLFFLRSSMDAPTLLFAVLATRIIAVCADALACIAGVIMRRQCQGATA